MPKKLIDRFIENREIDGRDGLYTRLTKRLPARFGVPQASHRLLIRRTVLNEDLLAVPKHTDHILYCHHISTPSRDLVGLNLGGADGDGIQVAANDWQVDGIPRSYTREFLTQDVQYWVMDYEVDGAGCVVYDTDGKPKGGVLLKSIFIQDRPRDLLAWRIILREFSDRTNTATEFVTY